MTPERDTNTGQYSEQYPTNAFLEAVTALDTATTQAVADHVGCSYDLAYRRLHNLLDTTNLTNTKVGGTYIWTLPDDSSPERDQ